jgi:hypothetical protein
MWNKKGNNIAEKVKEFVLRMNSNQVTKEIHVARSLFKSWVLSGLVECPLLRNTKKHYCASVESQLVTVEVQLKSVDILAPVS